MTPKLSEELCQAIAEQPERPLQVEDPQTHIRYVLVRADLYERLQQAIDDDAREPDPRAFYAAFGKAVQDDLDAPGMERYDDDAGAANRP